VVSVTVKVVSSEEDEDDSSWTEDSDSEWDEDEVDSEWDEEWLSV
jgi:hypothetical protein